MQISILVYCGVLGPPCLRIFVCVVNRKVVLMLNCLATVYAVVKTFLRLLSHCSVGRPLLKPSTCPHATVTWSPLSGGMQQYLFVLPVMRSLQGTQFWHIGVYCHGLKELNYY